MQCAMAKPSPEPPPVINANSLSSRKGHGQANKAQPLSCGVQLWHVAGGGVGVGEAVIMPVDGYGFLPYVTFL